MISHQISVLSIFAVSAGQKETLLQILLHMSNPNQASPSTGFGFLKDFKNILKEEESLSFTGMET
jgi:hypothetical protein